MLTGRSNTDNNNGWSSKVFIAKHCRCWKPGTRLEILILLHMLPDLLHLSRRVLDISYRSNGLRKISFPEHSHHVCNLMR
ncbi:hypothetical protein chiPu_0000913 [Chiloscyllium punctatum]|uniref:Uncharacterized protein n=1 Tax=Chiloscyllium punctatum TaxID=137246 RepID=A0A401RWK1_CHIPU|nr:hypothetical protein [Chiloscyllium punctatum]